MYRSYRSVCLILWISVSTNWAYDDSDISSESSESGYSKSSHESDEGYSHGGLAGDNNYRYEYKTRHSSSPLLDYSFEYASGFDDYLPLEIELDIDLDLSDLDYDTDLDYDSYFDYDLDYDPDLDPDFIKYKYRLYGLNHYGLHGSLYDELKFRNRFKKWTRRPYFRKLGYNRLTNKLNGRPFASSWKYPNLDFDLDDWGLGLGKYGLRFDYDKYALDSPVSYVKVLSKFDR